MNTQTTNDKDNHQIERESSDNATCSAEWVEWEQGWGGNFGQKTQDQPWKPRPKTPESTESTAECSRLFPQTMQAAMLFAARYTHHRRTGATMTVIRALTWCWDQLDARTQEQILDESYEATCHLEEWAKFRKDHYSANN